MIYMGQSWPETMPEALNFMNNSSDLQIGYKNMSNFDTFLEKTMNFH